MTGHRVQVWVVEPPPESLATDWAILAEAERRHAASIGHPAARSRAVTARAALRRLLGLELGVAPEAVDLHVGAGGRPELAGRADGPWCSVSHTRGLVVVACAASGPVGVDVERRDRRRLPPPDTWLSSPERSDLDRSGTCRERLLRRWTAKEAVAKALGTGFATPLREIRVDDDPTGGPAATAVVSGHPGRWRVGRLDVGPAHLASLATSGQPTA